MNLAEALAVRLMLKGLGYPNKYQLGALRQAERIIADAGSKAVQQFIKDANSEAPGQRGHSAGAVEIDGNPVTGPAAAPSIPSR